MSFVDLINCNNKNRKESLSKCNKTSLGTWYGETIPIGWLV